ncbi:MAG: thiolase domain-containing protein [Candidatus Marinimicrobia bacterium]|nr:thiolase domain-containing protein [Candidatus Neomarinimicrobiota bacterium]MBL7022686.1 thiolase domain-containing protein [Candidatus Neomarinimicrobiota bacterium]
MIKFSERQLRIPKMMRPVYMVTGGMSKFGRAIPEKRTEELVIDAFTEAAEFIGKTPAELKQYIHSCYYGHFADHFGDQLLGESVIHDRLGLDPLGNVGIKTGGATGGSTLWEAYKAVASGYSDTVLAMGWERMDEVPTDEGNNYISCAADKDWETPLGHIYTGYYAVMAQKYWNVFGKEEESFRRTMAEISVKNHGYARMNPHAQAPMDITVDDVLNSPVVAYPLRALDCCLMSVGAACTILCDEKTAYELTDNPLKMYVSAGSHTLRVADRRDMEIPLLPNESADQYKDLGDRFPGGDRYPGFTGFLAARMAAYYAYHMAGVVDPNVDFDLVELHDAFTISDIQTYEDVGIRPYGEGRTYVESGECYHTNPLTGKPGQLPANLSGGLIGTMHAVGATGIMQAIEVGHHIWGRWSEMHGDQKKWDEFGREKPKDWKDLQVKDAKRGMAISHAGVGSHVTATILAHPDHLLEGGK